MTKYDTLQEAAAIPVGTDMELVWQEISKSPRVHELEAMQLLFNHDGSKTNLPLREVGEQIGVSAERIRQIRAHSLRRLVHPVRRRRFEESAHL